MKKSLLTVAGFAVALSLNAQIKNKNGVSVLPEEGEYGISIDATPFLNYAGQLLSNAGSVAPTWNFLNGNNTLIGKRMMSSTMAYRGILRIGFTNTSTSNYIMDARVAPPTYPAVPAMVEDVRKVSTHYVGIGAGIEKRRGATRLQGVYGADAMFWLAGGKTSYEYGNALQADSIPVAGFSTTNFGSNITTDTYGNAARVTENKLGSTFGFGIRAFVGVEYFFAPRISLGAEFGWGIGMAFTGEGSSTRESVGGVPASVGPQEIKTAKFNTFMLDVDRNAFGTGNGALKLSFYF